MTPNKTLKTHLFQCCVNNNPCISLTKTKSSLQIICSLYIYISQVTLHPPTLPLFSLNCISLYIIVLKSTKALRSELYLTVDHNVKNCISVQYIYHSNQNPMPHVTCTSALMSSCPVIGDTSLVTLQPLTLPVWSLYCTSLYPRVLHYYISINC